MQSRAYSVLHVKAVDDGARVIEGIASTPTPDRMGDIVEPMGAKFALPMPLLWQHDHSAPIGHVEFAKPTRKGIPFKARLAQVDEPGALKDRLDEAWQSIRAGLVRAVSIGFRALEWSRMDDGNYHFLKWEWLELSAVTIPANSDATITTIKSIDRRTRAALGQSDVEAQRGVSRIPNHLKKTGDVRMDIETQVAELEERRDALATDMKAFGDVTDLDAEQADEFDRVSKEFDEAETQLARAKRMLRAASGAREVNPVVKDALASPRVPAQPKKQTEKGIRFARYAIAMARARGDSVLAYEHAKTWAGDTPEVGRMIKAVAGTAEGGSGTWGSELVEPITREFMELLMPRTVIGRVDGWDRMPFNTRIIEQTDGGLVNWVGELDPKPVGEMAFSDITLPYHKIAGIVVLSEELIRLSTPSAEARVRDQLVRDVALFMDQQLLLSTVTATADRPAAITNTISGSASAGTDGDGVRTDIYTILAAFAAANINGMPVFVMRDQLAAGIGLLTNALGQTEFGTLNATGGSLLGYQVVTSNAAPSGEVIAFVPGEIALADDGVTVIDASREATLDMAGGGTPTYSLFQRNAVAVRAERWTTWLRKRTAAVQRITGAAYAPAVPS